MRYAFIRLDMANPFDADRVTATITDSHIWPFVSDDSAPGPEEFRPAASPSILYLGAWGAGEEYLGLFGFFPQNGITWEVHTCLLPRARGRAAEIARQAAEWVFQFTPCRRIITSVPESNRLALRLAERVGFIGYGVNEASWLKHGKVEAQVCLGLSKPNTTGGKCQ